jgi:hypothetical protein
VTEKRSSYPATVPWPDAHETENWQYEPQSKRLLLRDVATG